LTYCTSPKLNAHNFQPSGQPATIKFLTVGGRTSAFVAELQHLNSTQADPKAVAAVAAADMCADVDKDGVGPTTKAKAGVKRKKVEKVQYSDPLRRVFSPSDAHVITRYQ
jgi:formamidopyrimidine-DNA glycosylase